ncbi:DUF1471 domain-containing protein [Escherichia coli]|uniref:DUF1471 domain-containing protein n=1 Tax=Escherichia coli TaxID=562 RepID=UPI0020215536|nr:DUF1471 domain-containing protein [Escherichia coli]
MFSRVLALLAVLLLSANTWAAIEINNHQARNMDDVQSLGVIYINHNFATESEARQALNEETDAQGATYYHVILMFQDQGIRDDILHVLLRCYLLLVLTEALHG